MRSLLLFSVLVLSALCASAQARLLVPLYSYPGVEDSGAYGRVATQSALAPISVIVNPCSGPAGPTAPPWCSATDGAQHRLATDTLRAGDPSLRILGYVATGYVTAEGPTTAAIRADIDAWATQYAGPQKPDGLFFDEASSGAASAALYRDLCTYAKAQGFSEVVLNPGTDFDPAYLVGGDCDAGVAFEDYLTGGDKDWATYEIDGDLLPYAPESLAMLIHDVPVAEGPGVIDMALDRGFGYVYVTNDSQLSGGNPWNQLDDGFEAQVDRVRLYNEAATSIVIDGRLGFRYLGAPADGVTLDDLADMNLVRGVPGYYPNARAPNIWTDYDAALGSWVPSAGTGEVLQLGRGFRWQMYDKNQGNPNVSLGYAFPVTISTELPANTADVDVSLKMEGGRFNFIANPFGETLDLTGIATWPGGDELSPNAPLWVYDPETRTWVEDPASVAPWQAFRAKAKGPRVNGNPRILTIPFSATTPASATRSAATPRLAFTLSGTDAQGHALADRALSIRFSDDAHAGFDADEDTPKFQVPSEAYALIGTRAGGAFLGHDVRPFADATIPLAVEARGTASTFTLAWDATTLPVGLPVALVDLQTGQEVDVRLQSSATFEVAPRPAHDEAPLTDLADGMWAVDRFVLRLGQAQVVPDASGAAAALEPVVPNPSAGEAQVVFTLPEAGRVRLTLIDVRGREVATLADGPRAAGRHEVSLGDALAAGVYVVRLQAGRTIVTRQVAIVR